MSVPVTVATAVAAAVLSGIEMLVVTVPDVSVTEMVGAVLSMVKASSVSVLLFAVPSLTTNVQL